MGKALGSDLVSGMLFVRRLRAGARGSTCAEKGGILRCAPIA
jgi:hypothetical protein